MYLFQGSIFGTIFGNLAIILLLKNGTKIAQKMDPEKDKPPEGDQNNLTLIWWCIFFQGSIFGVHFWSMFGLF